LRPHIIHTSMHSLPSSHNEVTRARKRPGGPSSYWDCEATCTERIQCGTAGRSTRWGEAWQAWQGSGSMLATMLANRTLLDLLRCWLAAAIAFVRGVFASRQVWEMCCPCRPLSWPATCSPVLRVVRPHQSRCLFGCACRRAPADKRIVRRGCTWLCRRECTNTGP
jgi:hypothetical protein